MCVPNIYIQSHAIRFVKKSNKKNHLSALLVLRAQRKQSIIIYYILFIEKQQLLVYPRRESINVYYLRKKIEYKIDKVRWSSSSLSGQFFFCRVCELYGLRTEQNVIRELWFDRPIHFFAPRFRFQSR